MAKYAEWYAVELDGYLKGRVSDVQRFEAIKEISNHFAEHVDDLVEKGLDPIQAEKIAIKTFGSPRQAAMNLIGLTNNPRIGRLTNAIGALFIVLTIFDAILSLFAMALHFDIPEWTFVGAILSYQCVLGLLFVTTIALLLGTLLTKKVPVRILVSSSLIALSIVTIVGLSVGTPDYGRVKSSQLSDKAKEWRQINEAAWKLSDIDEKIRKTVRKGSSGGHLATISSLAPGLLEGKKLGYVDVVGRETSGYLVPAGSVGINNIGFHEYDHVEYKGETTFPFAVYNLKYVKDGEEAIACWLQDGTYFYRETPLQKLAIDQLNFAAGAEHLNKFLKFDGVELVRDGEHFKVRETGAVAVQFDTPFPASQEVNHVFIEEQVRKCDKKIDESDFGGAITNARSLVEAVLLEIEKQLSPNPPQYDGDLIKLNKRVQTLLNLDPARKDISEMLRQVLSGLTSVVNGLASMRNKMSDAHASSYKASKHHAKLAVNSAKTFADFIFDSYSYQKGTGKLK